MDNAHPATDEEPASDPPPNAKSLPTPQHRIFRDPKHIKRPKKRIGLIVLSQTYIVNMRIRERKHLHATRPHTFTILGRKHHNNRPINRPRILSTHQLRPRTNRPPKPRLLHTNPTANHDNHFANWGTGHTSRTAVIAKNLTEKDLLDAIDQRLVYASEDENLAVHFYADGRFPMGANMETTAKTFDFTAFLQDPDYDGNFQVRLIHGHINGQHDNTVQEVTKLDTVSKDNWLKITAKLDKPGKHFFYLEVLETDVNRMAWTAPIWITKH